MKPPVEYAAKTRALYDRLIDALREVAKEHGYALGVHGSLARDIDLIAVPWTPDATPEELAEAIREMAARINGFAFIKPHEDDDWHRVDCRGMKPHGRRVWSFHLGGGPYIDLSVMPPVDTHDSEQQWKRLL